MAMVEATEDTARLIRENWLRVSEQVAESCFKAGRDSGDVRIVGVSKYVDAPLTAQLVQAGCTILGENRPQQIWQKADELGSSCAPEWHMIGHFQRNKIRRTLPHIGYLHSLDSLRLAQALNEELQRIDSTLDVLLEVNVTQDESKTGLPPSAIATLLDRAEDLPAIRWQGVMAMSTHHATEDETRDEFARVRELRDQLNERYPQLTLNQLSMGMSGDFREAILEGATLVRIGSSLWQGVLER